LDVNLTRRVVAFFIVGVCTALTCET